MATLRTTVGQLLVNELLPEDMRDYHRVLDKKELMGLMREVAERHPTKYKRISHDLARLAADVSTATGGNSFGLRHLSMAPSATAARKLLRMRLDRIMDDDSLTDDQRDEAIIRETGKLMHTQQDEIYKESLKEGNPLARQILSGAKGSKMNLASLRGSDLLYVDHRGRVLPVPVLHSYSQGVSPVEYWAGAYGTRKGIVDLKFATADAGFLSKQLNQIVHRSLVTGLDDEADDTDKQSLRGFPVDVNDTDNVGTLLARETAGYQRNTTLTPQILAAIKRRGHKRILVRSPITSNGPGGGVLARDVGIREHGTLPVIGEAVGATAAQSLSEPLTQAQISSKHSGGVAAGSSAAIGGFALINQLVQIPRVFRGGAAHAEVDGRVANITKTELGDSIVRINGEDHFVPRGHAVTVKPGQEIEAGDILSEGIPNPAKIVQHKGIGEGRRYFIDTFRKAFDGSGIARKTGTRRNIELVARGLINHVELTDEMGDYAPGDVVPYSLIEQSYQPRADAQRRIPRKAVGHYLEQPVLHYSIGTKVRPSMLRDFEEFGVKDVLTHAAQPAFIPRMIRGMGSLQHDPDWQVRMLGSGLKSSLLKSVHRGGTSDAEGTSYVPALVDPTQFGQRGFVRTPKRPPAVDAVPSVLGDVSVLGGTLPGKFASGKTAAYDPVLSVSERMRQQREAYNQSPAGQQEAEAAYRAEHLADQQRTAQLRDHIQQFIWQRKQTEQKLREYVAKHPETTWRQTAGGVIPSLTEVTMANDAGGWIGNQLHRAATGQGKNLDALAQRTALPQETWNAGDSSLPWYKRVASLAVSPTRVGRNPYVDTYGNLIPIEDITRSNYGDGITAGVYKNVTGHKPIFTARAQSPSIPGMQQVTPEMLTNSGQWNEPLAKWYLGDTPEAQQERVRQGYDKEQQALTDNLGGITEKDLVETYLTGGPQGKGLPLRLIPAYDALLQRRFPEIYREIISDPNQQAAYTPQEQWANSPTYRREQLIKQFRQEAKLPAATPEQLAALAKAETPPPIYQRAYPRAYSASKKQFTPAESWAVSSPELRRQLLAKQYDRYGMSLPANLDELAQVATPPPEFQQFYSNVPPQRASAGMQQRAAEMAKRQYAYYNNPANFQKHPTPSRGQWAKLTPPRLNGVTQTYANLVRNQSQQLAQQDQPIRPLMPAGLPQPQQQAKPPVQQVAQQTPQQQQVKPQQPESPLALPKPRFTPIAPRMTAYHESRQRLNASSGKPLNLMSIATKFLPGAAKS